MIAVLTLLVATTLSAEETQTFRVGDVDRQAIVCAPTKKTPHPPIILAYHGHGGTARYAMRKFGLESLWPEAVVVYPQGLPTATRNDLRGERNGWQNLRGVRGDRDLHFFDTICEAMKKRFDYDPKRVYVMGHSNGAGFTYLLWAERGDRLVAVAPVAGVAFGQRGKLKPLPALIVAGEKDTVVPFQNQMRSIETLKEIFGVDSGTKNEPLGDAKVYKGKKDLGIWIYPDGHTYPDKASRLIVDFFKAR